MLLYNIDVYIVRVIERRHTLAVDATGKTENHRKIDKFFRPEFKTRDIIQQKRANMR